MISTNYKLRVLTVALIVTTSVVLLAGCEARREFNYGVTSYKDGDFENAATHFKRSAEAQANPRATYNLALSTWKAFQKASAMGQKPSEGTPRAEPVRDRVAMSLESGEASEELSRDLRYLKGLLEEIMENRDEARRTYERISSESPNYIPALRALVRIEHKTDDPLTQLVLHTTEEEALSVIEDYSRF